MRVYLSIYKDLNDLKPAVSFLDLRAFFCGRPLNLMKRLKGLIGLL